ncbi:hypothetical protein SD81_002160 [Tolypothrix campylonemoides VB511288]|nr:hypothetical protein SD81_002160 [Tolypothrix campylonemoides VB511288]
MADDSQSEITSAKSIEALRADIQELVLVQPQVVLPLLERHLELVFRLELLEFRRIHVNCTFTDPKLTQP